MATEQLPIENSEEWLQLEFVRIAPVSKHDDDAIEGVDYWNFKTYAWDMYSTTSVVVIIIAKYYINLSQELFTNHNVRITTTSVFH